MISQKGTSFAVGPKALEGKGKLDETSRPLADKMAEEEFWKAGSRKLSATLRRAATYLPAMVEGRKMDEHDDDFAARFGMKGFFKEQPVVPNPNIKLETTCKAEFFHYRNII